MANIYVPELLTFSWQPPVKSIEATPPAHNEGDRYLVAASGTSGDFTGMENHIAWSIGGAWQFIPDGAADPRDGTKVWNTDTGEYLTFHSSVWNSDSTAIVIGNNEMLVGTGTNTYTGKTYTEIMALLSNKAGAAFDFNSQDVTGVDAFSSASAEIAGATTTSTLKVGSTGSVLTSIVYDSTLEVLKVEI